MVAFRNRQVPSRALSRDGISVTAPDEAGRELIHHVIYDELCQGIVRSDSKTAYLREIEHLRAAGADGVILGCTEITMLIGQDDLDLPVFDTTRIHATSALDFAIGKP